MNIAVYGGSFDPVHIGHQALVRYVATELPYIDCVRLLVTPRNPLKPDDTHASFADRMAMASIALSDIDNTEVSGFESTLPSPHFTYATLCAMRISQPDHRLHLLVGADNWKLFGEWRDSAEIIRDFGVLVYPRPGVNIDPASLPANVTYLSDAPQCDISSTHIRYLLSVGHDVDDFLPHGVYSYIMQHNLYR